MKKNTYIIFLLNEKFKIIFLILFGFLIRFLFWLIVPKNEFGLSGDEVSYYRCGLSLSLLGRQDIFWAPMTGWIIAFLNILLGTEKIFVFRLFWVILDTFNILFIYLLSKKILFTYKEKVDLHNLKISFFSSLFYCLYLPSIGYANHITSEIPSLFFLLGMLLLLDFNAPFEFKRMIIAGLLGGLMILTRPNLAAVIPLIAIGILFMNYRKNKLLITFIYLGIYILFSILLPLFWSLRNYINTGYLFLNLSYPSGFLRAQMRDYVEDLRLIDSYPTKYEINARISLKEKYKNLNSELLKINNTLDRLERQKLLKNGLLNVKGLSPKEVFEKKSEAIKKISDVWEPADLIELLRRGFTRMLRTLAPKTGVFDIVSSDLKFFHPYKLILFSIANLQWFFILFFGFAGIFSNCSINIYGRLMLLLIIFGCLISSFFAHGEPRYSFPIEHCFIILSFSFILNIGDTLKNLLRSKISLILFCIVNAIVFWGWLSSAIWGFSKEIISTW